MNGLSLLRRGRIWARNTNISWLLGVCVTGTLLIGCKTTETQTESAPSASGSVQANASTCDKYKEALCDKAGAESPTCESVKTTADVLPPAACSAGLSDLDYSVGKLKDLRKSCDTLVKNLCAKVGPKTQTCELVAEQTKQFPPERCKEMLKHEAEVVASLKQMEAANQPLSAELQTALTQGPVPAFGPEDAKVKIVEFSDFQCPYCSRAADTVEQIRDKYGDKVRFVFRQFPLPSHNHALEAAVAALAAHQQGKFWAYHDELFENQDALDSASLEKHAKAVGLDIAKFKMAMADPGLRKQVEADLSLGEKAAVQGTPTLFINGERVENPLDLDAVSRQIEAALKGA